MAGAKEVRQGGKAPSEAAGPAGGLARKGITPWEAVKPDFGKIVGDEGIIRDKWEEMERHVVPSFDACNLRIDGCFRKYTGSSVPRAVVVSSVPTEIL